MKKTYKNPQIETVQFAAGELMGTAITSAPIPGPIDAPSRGYRPF